LPEQPLNTQPAPETARATQKGAGAEVGQDRRLSTPCPARPQGALRPRKVPAQPPHLVCRGRKGRAGDRNGPAVTGPTVVLAP